MSWVGLRFKDGGRARDGVDCWGLVRLYLQEEAGLVLPSYGETPASDMIGSMKIVNAEIDSGAWQRVKTRTEVQRYDVALLWCFERIDGRPVKSRRHLGVMVANKQILHVEENIDSVIVPLSHPSVRYRLESFWRHRDLIEAQRVTALEKLARW